jgi:hypothetical protein
MSLNLENDLANINIVNRPVGNIKIITSIFTYTEAVTEDI